MFDRFYITQRGKALLAKAQSGVALNFSRMQIGDGQLSVGQNPVSMTSVIHPIKTIPISDLSVSGIEAAVSGQVTNLDLDTAFYFREIGLFAADPDYGEILYAYANAGTKADLIPAPYDSEVDFIFSLVCTTDNAETITFTAQPSNVFATQAQLGEVQTEIGNKLAADGDKEGWWHGSADAVQGIYISQIPANVTHPGDERRWKPKAETQTEQPEDGGTNEPTNLAPTWDSFSANHPFAVGDRFSDGGVNYLVKRAFYRQDHYRPPALLGDFYVVDTA